MSRKAILRLVLVLGVVALVIGVIYVLYWTPEGAKIRANRHEFHEEFRQWVKSHGLIAPIVFILLYVIVSLCLVVPVWPLGILAGFGFGVWLGVLWCLVGATASACVTFLVSRTLLGEYVQRKFEARHAKLRELDEKMGHNGMLVVMAARLMHFLPFGASNYLFGITRITLLEVTVGTFLGTMPTSALWAASGAGIHPRDHRWLYPVIGLINVLLFVPILLRYLKPHWFKKIGVE